MNRVILWLLSIWTSISVFSQTDVFYEKPDGENIQNQEYEFVPDTDSPGVEVAPLEVNSEDEDIPVFVPNSAKEDGVISQ